MPSAYPATTFRSGDRNTRGCPLLDRQLPAQQSSPCPAPMPEPRLTRCSCGRLEDRKHPVPLDRVPVHRQLHTYFYVIRIETSQVADEPRSGRTVEIDDSRNIHIRLAGFRILGADRIAEQSSGTRQ